MLQHSHVSISSCCSTTSNAFRSHAESRQQRARQNLGGRSGGKKSGTSGSSSGSGKKTHKRVASGGGGRSSGSSGSGESKLSERLSVGMFKPALKEIAAGHVSLKSAESRRRSVSKNDIFSKSGGGGGPGTSSSRSRTNSSVDLLASPFMRASFSIPPSAALQSQYEMKSGTSATATLTAQGVGSSALEIAVSKLCYAEDALGVTYQNSSPSHRYVQQYVCQSAYPRQ